MRGVYLSYADSRVARPRAYDGVGATAAPIARIAVALERLDRKDDLVGEDVSDREVDRRLCSSSSVLPMAADLESLLVVLLP